MEMVAKVFDQSTEYELQTIALSNDTPVGIKDVSDDIRQATARRNG